MKHQVSTLSGPLLDLIQRLRAASAGTEEWRVLSKDGGIVAWYSRHGVDAVLNPERSAREWLREAKERGYLLGDRVERATMQTQNQRLMAEAADALERAAAGEHICLKCGLRQDGYDAAGHAAAYPAF